MKRNSPKTLQPITCLLHIDVFTISFLVPALTPSPHSWDKSFMYLISWENIRKTHPHNFATPTNRDRKNHDSQRRDRILRFFLRPEVGQFCGHFLTKLHSKPGVISSGCRPFLGFLNPILQTYSLGRPFLRTTPSPLLWRALKMGDSFFATTSADASGRSTSRISAGNNSPR